MRTDTLTTLLLDPFLTFDEAAKECGATARQGVVVGAKVQDRPSRVILRRPEGGAPRLPLGVEPGELGLRIRDRRQGELAAGSNGGAGRQARTPALERVH